jgi:hypothetical protein
MSHQHEHVWDTQLLVQMLEEAVKEQRPDLKVMDLISEGRHDFPYREFCTMTRIEPALLFAPAPLQVPHVFELREEDIERRLFTLIGGIDFWPPHKEYRLKKFGEFWRDKVLERPALALLATAFPVKAPVAPGFQAIYAPETLYNFQKKITKVIQRREWRSKNLR